MAGEPFSGCYTVLVTPFTEGGAAIDVPALQRLVEYQIENGVRGLIPLGSTGEFLSISREERAQVVETVIAAGRVPVLIGTGEEDTRLVVALSKEAEAMGADGVMLGGAALAGMAPRLQDRTPVPLLDGIVCALRMAEMLVGLGLPKPAAGLMAPPKGRASIGLSEPLAANVAPPVATPSPAAVL